MRLYMHGENLGPSVGAKVKSIDIVMLYIGPIVPKAAPTNCTYVLQVVLLTSIVSKVVLPTSYSMLHWRINVYALAPTYAVGKTRRKASACYESRYSLI